MENALGITYTNAGRRYSNFALIRYADDFVVACKSEQAAYQAKKLLNSWLAPRGLQLSEAKTRVLHIEDGFYFLGFNVRQYKSKGKSKLLIKPSKESILEFRNNLRKAWKGLRGHPVTSVLSKINPIIRGWANYFKIGVSKKVFSGLDNWLFTKQFRWAKRTHPKKGLRWLKDKYWSIKIPKRQDRWIFGYQDKTKGKDHHMVRLAWTPIKRHVKVKGNHSPFERNLRDYWLKREKSQIVRNNIPPPIRNRSILLFYPQTAAKQKARCSICMASLLNGEMLHMHHKSPKAKGGKDKLANLSILHAECHRKVHSLKLDKREIERRQSLI